MKTLDRISAIIIIPIWVGDLFKILNLSHRVL